jgi:hypothetical protein
MSILTTKKAIKENYKPIIAIGYCDAQTLLRYETPIAHSAGVYGWSCDYYLVNGTLISTGYSPIEGIRDYELTRKYEDKARNIMLKHHDWQKEKTLITRVLQDYINRMLNKKRR